MAQLIDKDTLAAEIEKRIKKLQDLFKEDEKKLDSFQKIAILLCIEECKVVLNILNTLKAKEVDFKKELNYEDYLSFFKEHPDYGKDDWGFDECWVFAKYFFELGLKTKKGE